MLKTLYMFLFGLIVYQNANAQKADSVLLYMSNLNRIVDTKDSADHYLLILNPPDSSTGVKINHVEEYYLNKQPRFIGAAALSFRGRYIFMKLEGPGIYYYPNGTKRSMVTFRNGSLNGYSKTYYPNGKFYSLSLNSGVLPYGRGNKLIECRDSTGKVLTQNGNGK